MTAFIFSGDPKAKGKDPSECEIAGIKFPLGQAVPVKDEATADRLRRHSHFTEADESASDDDGLDDLSVAQMRALAAERNIDVEGLKKAEILAKLRG